MKINPVLLVLLIAVALGAVLFAIRQNHTSQPNIVAAAEGEDAAYHATMSAVRRQIEADKAVINGGASHPSETSPGPFAQQIYRTPDGSVGLVVLSASECEYHYLAAVQAMKYTERDGVIRAVSPGGDVQYFQRVAEGLKMSNGTILRSPEALVALHNNQISREARIQEEKRAVRTATQQLGGPFSVLDPPNGFGITKERFVVSDVGLNFYYQGPDGGGGSRAETSTIWFDEVTVVGPVEVDEYGSSFGLAFYWMAQGAPEFGGVMGYVNKTGHCLRFGNAAEAQAAQSAVQTAFEAWKSKFPDLVRAN